MPSATIDQLSFPFAITSVALGDLIWDRDHQAEIALLAEDVTVHLLARGQEVGISDRESSGAGGKKVVTDSWSVVASHQLPATSGQQLALVRAKVSGLPTDDLVVMDRASGS